MIVSKYYIEDLFLEELSINFGDKLNMPDCVDDGSFEKVTGYPSYKDAVEEFIIDYRSEHHLLKEIYINGDLYFKKVSIDDYFKT